MNLLYGILVFLGICACIHWSVCLFILIKLIIQYYREEDANDSD